MLCLGIFHGFAHGSCSTTGYSGDYGPVPRCAKGIGWWMLMLFGGLIVAGIGAVLARSFGALLVPLVFVAVGAPFVALAFGNHGQLMFNASSGTGKIFAGVFGGCFVVSGLIWGAFAARGITGVSGASVLAGLLAAVVGVAAAFAIAGGVSSAIGKTTTPGSVQYGNGITVLSPAAERAREISLCKNLVAGWTVISPRDRASLSAECRTNWKAAEHRLSAVAKRAVVAHNTAQCVKASSGAGLPGSSASILAHACRHPATSSHGSGLKSVQTQMCRQVVKAQVPASVQQQALAACGKL
jgi:hypothetical protein